VGAVYVIGAKRRRKKGPCGGDFRRNVRRRLATESHGRIDDQRGGRDRQGISKGASERGGMVINSNRV